MAHPPRDRGSSLEHDGGPFEARHAGHDLAPGGLLVGREEVVVVQDLSLVRDHGCLALSARTAPTHVGGIDSGRLDRLKHALVLANPYAPAGKGERDVV